MRIAIRHCGTAALIAAALSLSPMAFGQDVVTVPDSAVTQTTTTTSDGTVTEFSPTGNAVVLRTETSSTPIRYEYNKTTTVVDQDGNPVDVSVIKTGIPVHVFYDREGDQMVARKIIVERTVAAVPADPSTIIKKTTTTTTTTGPQ